VASIAIERTRAEKAIRESESLFRSLTETVSAGICIYTGQSFAYLNTAAEAITGYTRQELMSMNFQDIIHPDCLQEIVGRAETRHQPEQVLNRYETRILTRSGEERWVDITATSIRFQGQPAVLATGFDITEHKRAESSMRESEARYRLLFERNLAGVYRSAMDGTLMDCNDAAARIFGYASREEALSHSLWDSI
jgi:PAS domain S-box-containing protein